MHRFARRLLYAALFAVSVTTIVLAENPEHRDRFLKTRWCAACDLSGADLKGVIASDGDLRGANLQGADLYKARLDNARLDSARFDGANLSGANLSGASGADLANANTDETTTCPNGKKGPC